MLSISMLDAPSQKLLHLHLHEHQAQPHRGSRQGDAIEKQGLGPGCKGQGKKNGKLAQSRCGSPELKADWPQEEAAGAETLRQKELWEISWSGLGDMSFMGGVTTRTTSTTYSQSFAGLLQKLPHSY